MSDDLVAQARDITLAALFERSYQVFADRIAVTDGGAEMTYAELGVRAHRLAAGLRRLGLRRGDRIAILSPPSRAYVEAYAAAARLGVTVVALNTGMHVDGLAWCIDKAAPAAVFVAGAHANVSDRLGDRCSSVRDWILIDSSGYDRLLDNDRLDAPWPTGDDIHNVLFTSGTTGRPKGAMISQSAAATRGLRLADWFGLTPDDGFAGWLPLFHCGGDEPLYATIISGGRFAAVPTADTETLYRRIEGERLTWTLLLPGVITDFLDHPARRDHDLTSLRFAAGYANMMPTVVARVTAALDIGFFDAFGQTEASLLVAHGWSGPGEVPTGRKVWCPHVSIRLVDVAGDRVPPGTPGECLVRGPSLMSGYLGDPAATAEAFADGWLHTGDVLVEHEDGTFTYVDRAKYLIKTGGENVYPAEVEQALVAHPSVREACAFGVPDDTWGEAVKVVVVTVEGTVVTGEELVQWCRDRIAGYKRPRYVQFLTADQLPRSATGKLQRHILSAAGTDPGEAV